MFYMNPKFKYQFFSPQPIPDVPSEPAVPTDNKPTNEPPKRNLVGALKALYVAYGGKEELNNNAVDIIYKIAEVINEKNNISDPPSEAGSGGPPSDGETK